jgi:ABC-type Fe3+/spermidine/putrescine transport system ATPase subunit
MVFQNYALFPHLNVFDNVAFGLRYRQVRPRDREVRVRSALERVSLAGLDRRYPAQLSGGQQQRVALARAIVLQPALLLLDEPLSNLDLRLRQQMRNELRAIQRDVRITTIFVTHDQAEAFSMSDRIAIMNRGQILQVGTPDDIYLRPASEFVVTFVGETNRVVGTVVAREHGDVVLRSEDGLLFRARESSDGESDHPVGGRRLLFFRVEQARLLRTPGAGNSLAAVVESVHNLGATMGYTVRLTNGSTLRAAMATTQSSLVRKGEAIFVSIDPADCILIRHD